MLGTTPTVVLRYFPSAPGSAHSGTRPSTARIYHRILSGTVATQLPGNVVCTSEFPAVTTLTDAE